MRVKTPINLSTTYILTTSFGQSIVFIYIIYNVQFVDSWRKYYIYIYKHTKRERVSATVKRRTVRVRETESY